MLRALLALALAPCIGGAAEVEIPANDGWVTDLAGLLTAGEERALEALMESYRAGSTHEVALLTVPSLEGEPIERFALEVARAWKIGAAETSAGALLVVSKGDRKLRIEVGRGLEGQLTDSISGRIIREVISPAFREGDFHGGLRRGIEAMHAAAGGDYGPIESTAEARRDQGGWAVIAGVLALIFLLGVAGRSRGGHARKEGGLWTLIWLASLLGQHGSPSRGRHFGGGGFGGGGGGGGFGGFGGGGGFSGGGASGGW